MLQKQKISINQYFVCWVVEDKTKIIMNALSNRLSFNRMGIVIKKYNKLINEYFQH
jgi:hypothetical protein